jgi:hypothetical protein
MSSLWCGTGRHQAVLFGWRLRQFLEIEHMRVLRRTASTLVSADILLLLWHSIFYTQADVFLSVNPWAARKGEHFRRAFKAIRPIPYQRPVDGYYDQKSGRGDCPTATITVYVEDTLEIPYVGWTNTDKNKVELCIDKRMVIGYACMVKVRWIAFLIHRARGTSHQCSCHLPTTRIQPGSLRARLISSLELRFRNMPSPSCALG